MIDLTGDKKLTDKLNNLSNKDLKRIVRTATRTNCKIVQTETKNLVPVDSGDLKKAIKVRSLTRSKNYVGSKTTCLFAGKQKSNMFYGSFQEYGFTTVNGRKIEGKHFMLFAAYNVGDRVLDGTSYAIRSGIEKVMKQ